MLDGKFRPDLYDRLAFEVINLPPLAQRMQDVPVLAAHFLSRFRQEVAGITVKEISAGALDRFASYDYPGNVRELKNIVERAVYMAQGEVLTAADVDAALPPEAGAQSSAAALAFEDDVRAAAARPGRRVRGLAVQGRAGAHPLQAEGGRRAARPVLRPVPPALPQVRPRQGLSPAAPAPATCGHREERVGSRVSSGPPRHSTFAVGQRRSNELNSASAPSAACRAMR